MVLALALRLLTYFELSLLYGRRYRVIQCHSRSQFRKTAKNPERELWWKMRSHGSQSLDQMCPRRPRRDFIPYSRYDGKLVEDFAQKSDVTRFLF